MSAADNDYAMSDDDLLNYNPETPVETKAEEVPATEQTTAQEVQEEVTGEETIPVVTATEETQVEETPASQETPTGEESSEEVIPANEVNYEDFYQNVTKTFKANGKEIQVTDPGDIIALMQQGANYSKKMAAIKPLMKIGRMLEEHQLMNEAELSYLIDLKNKNPEAIAKLVKESGIDLYEFDTAVGDKYVAPDRSVSDVSVELQNVLDDLQQNSPTYDRTIKVIGNDWDQDSRKILADNPQLIQIIDSQVQDGTFDTIAQVIEKDRMLGRLKGMSDLQAYKEVGERLQREYDAKTNAQKTKDTPAVTQVEKKPVASSTTPATKTPATNSRKAAAASPRKAPDVAAAPAPFNPLTLSDEEVLKLTAQTQFH